MLPANLAKGRTAARGLGELVMVGGPGGSGLLQTLRYSPYSVPPSTNTATMVALSQPMSFTSPAPTSVPISGAGSAMAPPSGMPLQLFGQFDAAAAAQQQANQASQMASINQLLASQLGLAAGKTGSLSYPSHMQAAPAGPGQTQGFGQLGLGYNVSDLLNLQGLQGLHGALQVPVGL